MVEYGHHLQASRSLGAALALVVASYSIYTYIRPVLRYQPNHNAIVVSRAREEARRLGKTDSTTDSLPYPPDVFPGGREVTTPYGTIKVFEWGPEDGEKVLLMHGIGTPCVALGDMAKELVHGGCRVMLFGKSTRTVSVEELY